MRPARVAIGAGVAAVARPVLASLPESYAPADDPSSVDVLVVSGSAGWPAAVRAALELAPWVILVQPTPTDPGLTPTAAARVVVDATWASNPAVEGAAPHTRRAAETTQLVEVQVVGIPDRDPGADLLDVATLLRATVGPLTEVSIQQHDEHGFAASGRAGGVAAALSVVRTTGTGPSARLRILTDQGGMVIALPDPSTARPGTVTITDRSGLRVLPTVWESGHRAAWRRLRHLIEAGDASNDLDHLAADHLCLTEALRVLDTPTEVPSAPYPPFGTPPKESE